MWLTYALLVALGGSFLSPITKKVLKNIHVALFFFFYNLLSILFLFIIIEFMGGLPKIDSGFYFNILMSALFDIVAFLAGTYALKHYPVSLLAPISAFNPIFATVISIFTLHETPTALKLLGILIIVIGAYFLDISEVKIGYLAPLKKLFANRGVQLYLLVDLIFGITPTFQKHAIFQTHPNSPFFISFASNFLVTLFMGAIGLKYLKIESKHVNKNIKWFILLGIINALTQGAAYYAFSLTNVSYSIAVSELSILLIIIWGGIFFKEEKIKDRLVGASIMIFGTILMAL